jgi:hypothetical protein
MKDTFLVVCFRSLSVAGFEDRSLVEVFVVSIASS